MKKMTILGGGNGGKAFGADMAAKGWSVCLYEVPEFAKGLEGIKANNLEIGILEAGQKSVAKLAAVTSDIEEALAFSDVIFVIMPGFGHKRIAELCAPHLKESQTYIFLPACFGAYEFYYHLNRMGQWKPVTLAETATLPYGTNAIGPAEVMIHVRQEMNPLGVFPASKTAEVAEILKDCDDNFVPVRNLLDVATLNLNPSAHVVPCLLSASAMEGNKDYKMYRDAFTPSVCKLILKIDAERLAVREALGFGEPNYPLQPGLEMALPYFGTGESYLEARKGIPGPFSVEHRYVTEDAPFGIAFFASLAKKVGVTTPATDTVLQLAGLLNDADYMASGRTLENLGLADTGVKALTAFLDSGSWN